MFITFLGSSAKQTEMRECVSILMEDDSSLLFDVGPGIVSALSKANRKASEVDHLILTHVHGDHILGYAYFIWSRNSELKSDKAVESKPLCVYGYEDSIMLAKQMVEGAYPGLKLQFDINYVILKNVDMIRISDTFCVKTIPGIHAVPSISSVIESNGKKIIYSSDTLPNKELMTLSYNSDFVIHEGMYTNANFKRSRASKHSTALDAGQFAQEIDAKHLALVHIAPQMFGKEMELLKEVSSVYNGCVSIPYDGSVFII